MADTSDPVTSENIRTLFDLVRENRTSTFLSVVGLLLLIVGVLSARTALKSRPAEIKPWLKWLLFGSLSAGIVFSIGGAVFALLSDPKKIPHGFDAIQTTPSTVLAHLKENSEVQWLIRLIPYDPYKSPEVSISRLTHLGRSDQRFSFVADYAELRGYSAYDAVQRVGGSMKSATRVSAVIFPVHGRQLYPANARGVLQVIKIIESDHNQGDQAWAGFNVDEKLSKAEIEDLERRDQINYWSWNSYGHYYKDYCAAVQKFRCGSQKFSAKLLMGDLSHDWHPLGFARKLPPPPSDEPCANPEAACGLTDWNNVSSFASTIGARVFLIENIELTRLDGRILIDFDEPKLEVIPDLGVGN